MSTVELKLKEQIANVGVGKVEKTEKTETEQKAKTPIISDDDEDDYFMRQARRIP